jgi:hypothetical protein
MLALVRTCVQILHEVCEYFKRACAALLTNCNVITCNGCVTAAADTGTGKTTVAQRTGRMFKQLGVLHSDEVICCAPADFSTGYAGGQAAIKTKGMLEKALGKTLLIDEAYGEQT